MKVYQAINAVQKHLLSGIGKNQKNSQQGFNFRGIDDVYNALAPALAEHGLVVLPEVLERVVTERQTSKGGVLFYVTLKVNYHFCCAEDGSKHVVCAYGEAMDSGDKATNKAMSAAYKYACFQAFCIPTENVDADSETHQPVSIEQQFNNCKNTNELMSLWKSLTPDQHKQYEKEKDAAKARFAKPQKEAA